MLQEDQIIIALADVPGLMDAIHTHAAQRGESVQAFILRAVQETMYNDTHPRTLDSDREIRQRIIEQYNKAEGD